MVKVDHRIESALAKVEKFEKHGFVGIGREDLPPYRIVTPFNWDSDPYSDSNWKFQVHTLRYLMIYYDAYVLTGEIDYFNILMDYLRDWLDYNEKRPAEFAWQDMATGIRSEKLYLILSMMRRSEINLPSWSKKMILLHVDRLMRPGFINENHNHGLYALHGLRCLSELLGPGKKKNVINFCKGKLESLLSSQFDEQYVHKENSPHYHHLVLDALKKYKSSGLYTEFLSLDKIIQGAEVVSKYFYLPDGREVPFGDTDNKRCLGYAGKAKFDKENWSFFNKSGYFIAKSDFEYGSFFCATNSYGSKIHKHADNLSFIWGESGQDIIVDPGKYKYTNDEIRRAVVNSSAHSVINFCDISWAVKDIKGVCGVSGVYNEPRGCYEAWGSVDLVRRKNLFSWKREFFYSPGNYLVVQDFLQGGKDGKALSRFVFDSSAEVISVCDGVVELVIGGLSLTCYCLCLNDEMNIQKGMVVLEETPVSYSYGSYVSAPSIKYIFSSAAITVFQLKGGNNALSELGYNA